jgi:hypothetical protein
MSTDTVTKAEMCIRETVENARKATARFKKDFGDVDYRYGTSLERAALELARRLELYSQELVQDVKRLQFHKNKDSHLVRGILHRIKDC